MQLPLSGSDLLKVGLSSSFSSGCILHSPDGVPQQRSVPKPWLEWMQDQTLYQYAQLAEQIGPDWV